MENENIEENSCQETSDAMFTTDDPALDDDKEFELAISLDEDNPPNDAPHDSTDLESLKSLGNELVALMQKLAADFNGKLKYDAKKQEQIDQLYNENLAFRDGLVERYKSKLVLAVIEQIDNAEKQIAHFRNVPYSEANYKKLMDSFEDIALGFRDMLLERFDVSSWQSDPDSPFDPRRQRSLRTTPTGDPSKAKTVRQSIRFGYEMAQGSTLRPEMVDVYVLDKNLVSPEEKNSVPAESQQVEQTSPPACDASLDSSAQESDNQPEQPGVDNIE